MPPGYWSKYLWALLHGICQRIDEVIRQGKMVLLIEVAQFLRAFCRLLPCPECQMHFTNLLQTDLLTKPAQGYFRFSVDARAKIAKRLGRPVREESYCKQQFDTEWFALAWNALQIMSFAYPLVADVAFQADIIYFFQFLGKFFPSAVASDWSATLHNILFLAPTMNSTPKIPTNQRKLMTLDVPGLVKEAGVVSSLAFNRFDSSKQWCYSRENFMHTVYALRKTVQKTPLLLVPPFETLIQQWVNELTQYVVQFRTGLPEKDVLPNGLNEKDVLLTVTKEAIKEPVQEKEEQLKQSAKEPVKEEEPKKSKPTLSQLKSLEKQTQQSQKKLDQLELQLRLSQEEEEKKKRKATLFQTHNEVLRVELESLKKAFDTEKLQFAKSQLALEEERVLFQSEKKAFALEKEKLVQDKFLFERNQKTIIS